ncbi:MAG: hypothetical protein ACTSRI_01155 [Promethearchaeota archaeon]
MEKHKNDRNINRNENELISWVSFSWKRFICAIMLLGIGIFDLIIFSPLSGRYVPTGSVMTFEGPSYFISTGLLPFTIGIGLILYSLLSYFKGKITKEADSIVIKEKRYFKKVETRINHSQILSLNLTNNEIGIKYLWLFIFIPYNIINFYYMVLNFNQPFIVGLINLTAIVILISIIISSICLTILFGFPEWLLEIYTDEGKFELWFEPFRNGREMIEKIAKTLGIIEGTEKENHLIKPIENISKRNFFLAFFFLGYGLFNVVSFMTTLAIFQTIICHVLLIMGAYLLSKEIRKLPFPLDLDNKNNIRYNIQSKYYQRYFFLKECSIREKKYLHYDFEVFWAACSGIIFLFIPFKIIQSWMVINEKNVWYILDNAVLITFFGVIIIFLVFIQIFVPDQFIFIKSGILQFKNFFTQSEKRNKILLKESMKKLIEAFKLNFKTPRLKKSLKNRLMYVITCFVLGFLMLLWEYFFYFNLFNIFNF